MLTTRRKQPVMKARDAMSSPVLTVRTIESVDRAAALLCENGFTSLPVVDDDDRLVGIVTEADVIRVHLPAQPQWQAGAPGVDTRRTGRTVGEVMTSPVESLTPGAEVADAARMMVDQRIRSLPIVDGHGVVGILTRRDVLRSGLNPAAT
jgi:CBS domain-containing protein